MNFEVDRYSSAWAHIALCADLTWATEPPNEFILANQRLWAQHCRVSQVLQDPSIQQSQSSNTNPNQCELPEKRSNPSKTQEYGIFKSRKSVKDVIPDSRLAQYYGNFYYDELREKCYTSTNEKEIERSYSRQGCRNSDLRECWMLPEVEFWFRRLVDEPAAERSLCPRRRRQYRVQADDDLCAISERWGPSGSRDAEERALAARVRSVRGLWAPRAPSPPNTRKMRARRRQPRRPAPRAPPPPAFCLNSSAQLFCDPNCKFQFEPPRPPQLSENQRTMGQLSASVQAVMAARCCQYSGVSTAPCQYSSAGTTPCQYSGVSTSARCQYSGPSTTPCHYSGANTARCQYSGVSTASCQNSDVSAARCQYSGAITAPCQYSGASTARCQYSGVSTTPCQYSGVGTSPCQYSSVNAARCHYSGVATTHYALNSQRRCGVWWPRDARLQITHVQPTVDTPKTEPEKTKQEDPEEKSTSENASTNEPISQQPETPEDTPTAKTETVMDGQASTSAAYIDEQKKRLYSTVLSMRPAPVNLSPISCVRLSQKLITPGLLKLNPKVVVQRTRRPADKLEELEKEALEQYKASDESIDTKLRNLEQQAEEQYSNSNTSCSSGNSAEKRAAATPPQTHPKKKQPAKFHKDKAVGSVVILSQSIDLKAKHHPTSVTNLKNFHTPPRGEKKEQHRSKSRVKVEQRAASDTDYYEARGAKGLRWMLHVGPKKRQLALCVSDCSSDEGARHDAPRGKHPALTALTAHGGGDLHP